MKTMKTTSRIALFTTLTATLAASAPTAALARPTIVIDEAIPFSADDLSAAVSIRTDSDAQIHVDRDGDVLVITVGDQARALAVDPAIAPHDLARVVALIIVALDAPAVAPLPPAAAPPARLAPPTPPAPPAPPAPAPPAPPAPPASPAPAPPARPLIAEMPPGSTPSVGANVLFGGSNAKPPLKNWTVRVQAGYAKSDLFDAYPVMATVSWRLGPSAHLVGGIGTDEVGVWSGMDFEQSKISAIPLRAGVELRHRWFAIEGGIAATRWEDPCNGTTYATGGYAAARAYLFPLGAIQNRFFTELGLRHVTALGCTVVSGDMQNRVTTVSASLGLELPL